MRPLVLWCATLSFVVGQAGLARAQAPSNGELYHVQFVKAAPGKLNAAIAAYLKRPTDKNNPEPPLIFRHVQGDDWHLMIIEARGKDETIAAVDTDQAMQQWVESARGLTVHHADTFTLGPPLAEVKKLFAAEPDAVFIATTFEPVPGHREQLVAALQSGASPDAPTLVLQHREGASWQLLSITRYASWAALGAAMQKNGLNPAVQPTNEHIAAHHDTLVQRVTAVPK
jgi:hypothetical protein